jgi:hypothetical protein
MRAAGIAVCLALLMSAPCVAEHNRAAAPLPQMAQCRTPSHPLLPERWHATFLMAPSTRTQLVLADIVEDNTLPAMRARLYGVKTGSADLLVAGNETYLLSGEECRRLGDTGWRTLPRDWVGGGAQCVGAAPVAETPVDWWKVPTSPTPLTNWIWFRHADGTPWRTMFVGSYDRLAPLGLYAFSYQVRFEALNATQLAEDVARCIAAPAEPRADPRRQLNDVIEGMARASSRADAAIKLLMPELTADCTGTGLPRWPDRFALTTFMTPIDVRYTPFPTEVLYQWDRPVQRTRMVYPPKDRQRTEDALLIGPRGYGVSRYRGGRTMCEGPQPGTVRPDWMAVGSCTCEALINGTTPLTPYGSTQIVSCPVGPRLFWTWYTLAGRPVVFMETSAGDERGALLTLSDYFAFAPDAAAPDAAFAKPAECRKVEGLAYSRRKPRPCFSCHLGAPEAGGRAR